ncbi:MAG TPA: hypothetical protein ENN99_05770 [Chloroflexi bacterium]|nr:hypothetical protein [Chloroflexota bacterium]
MRSNALRFWSLLLVGILALVGLGLLMAFLGREPGASRPIATTPEPTPVSTSDLADPIVAHVNGQPIRRSAWSQAHLLDQVMNRIAGQPPPTADETLQRLINEALLLEAFPPPREPQREEIEAQITALENAWGVDDDTVSAALKDAQLTRTAFEQAITHLIQVQESLEALQAQGHAATTWLETQRASAEILLTEDTQASAAQLPIVQPPAQTQSTPPETPVNTPPPSPSPAPPTVATAVSPTDPAPAPQTPALLEIAPDFSLPQAGSDNSFNLATQLSTGPVVLIFFQRCG